MFCFIKGTTSNPDKSSVVQMTASAAPFSNVCPNPVSGINHLLSNGCLSEVFPPYYYLPDRIRQLFCQLVSPEVFKVSSYHQLLQRGWGKQSTKHKVQSTKYKTNSSS